MNTALGELTNSVSVLWKKLEEMESERRFDGREYPSGTAKFPFRLTGQGFFPGGDGLWRDDERLASSSDGVLPANGVLFLGNDFGSLKSFARLETFENPLTWRNLKSRIKAAGILPHLTFCTNAFLGLREESRALDRTDWTTMPKFCDFCAEFLQFQLQQVRPKIVVLMGPHAQAAFDRLYSGSSMERSFGVLRTTHPYGDFNFTAERRAAEAKLLAEAWAAA
jgi:hypothetical protein